MLFFLDKIIPVFVQLTGRCLSMTVHDFVVRCSGGLLQGPVRAGQSITAVILHVHVTCTTQAPYRARASFPHFSHSVSTIKTDAIEDDKPMGEQESHMIRVTDRRARRTSWPQGVFLLGVIVGLLLLSGMT